ncbi:hypothetical protein GCM10025864_15510 [Luteimicrobium album]|uniref:Uncharacterized protein n=1 Tax=Luteimicrobium album TaxID=1054550 RepID=A0ABQ6I0N2_9MICO|nr:hypothetical protein GCM10025864_15510 [Luteimicrobium album]
MGGGALTSTSLQTLLPAASGEDRVEVMQRSTGESSRSGGAGGGYHPSGGASDYDADELAELTYQHVGAGDIPGRPSLQEIRTTLDRGNATRLPGQNSVQIDYKGVRVIINEDVPWRSTSYYPGK